MKYIQLKIVFCFVIIAFGPLLLTAQDNKIIDVEGVVIGAEKEPLSGVVLTSEKDGSVSTTTDSEGKFSIIIPSKSNLLVSAIGYKNKSVEILSELNGIIVIELNNDEKLVQVAFKKVAEKDLNGGVSFVNLPEILDKNYTTYSLDGLQAFVGGYNGNIWGTGGALVLVDGIPRNANTVMSTEIEQVTFLKGVSAITLYGSRAAKGVIYITTKKGKNQKQEIKVRANTGILTPKRFAKYLGSAEYMQYYNQARANDGLGELYSNETIYNHASGNSPYRYADVDYYSSDYISDFYTRNDANLEITGGGNTTRYYTTVNFSTEGDLLDFGEGKNNKNERFNIRGNVDFDINDRISAYIGANAIYYNGRGVNTDYWSSSATLRPHRFTPLLPIDLIEDGDIASETLMNNSNYLINGKYLLGGTQLDQTNPFAAMYAGGYNTYTNRQFQFNTGITADLGNLLDGLTFKTMFGVDYETSYSQSYNNNYAVYEASWNTYAGFDQILGLTKYGEDSKSGVQNISNSAYNQILTFSGQFDYEKRLKENHTISAMLLANGYQESHSELYHRISNANLGMQMGYNYDEKYYVDFKEAIVHSAKFAKGQRNATSPSLSLGWRLSEENFMKNSKVVDNLKLSFSAGILHTDLDVNDYYLYESIYSQTDGAWYSWRDGALNRTTDSRRGENLDLTFAKKEELNFGIEASFFDKLITLNSSFFASKVSGNAIQTSVLYPNYFTTGWPNSSFIPYVNYNDDNRIGFDFDLRINNSIGEVNWSLGLTGTYYDTRASKRAEMFEDDYQYREGKPLDAIWGLQNQGFFADATDVANSPTHSFGQVQPGDIKYKDQNGDGVINSQDEVYLGKAGWSGAPFTFGANLTAKWKNLTFFALVTGQLGAYSMKNNSYFWMDGEDKYSVEVRNSWTEGNKETATYPRLTTFNSDNNYRSSDFWRYSSDRLDLAKVQISYDFPENMFKNSFVSKIGIYVSGSNLLTVSRYSDIMELNIGQAPQSRFYNLGLKATF